MLTKKRIIALLVMFFTMTAFVEVHATIPTSQKSSKTATTKKKDKVVWGTQYDWLSTRYITYDDIRNYDSGQLRVLRNSIYARHGRYFKDTRLSDYFYSQSWYNPYRKEVPESDLNEYEKANIRFLKKYEK